VALNRSKETGLIHASETVKRLAKLIFLSKNGPDQGPSPTKAKNYIFDGTSFYGKEDFFKWIP
jgi:hypothetical protein